MSDGVMSSDNFNTAACESTGGIRQVQAYSPGGEVRNGPGGVDSTAHDAPLLWLRDNLEHLRGTTLAERVRRLRWRRKRPSAGQAGGAVDSGCSAAAGSRPDPLSGEGSGNDAAADGGNVSNESEVGGE